MRILLIVIVLFGPLTLPAQDKYWIYLKEPRAGSVLLSQPSAGTAIAQSHLDSLQKHGVQICYRSEWLNAVSAVLAPGQRTALQRLSFVAAVEPLRPGLHLLSGRPEGAGSNQAFALHQINGAALQHAGLSGKKTVVGIIDGGFLKAEENQNLKHVFANNQVLGSKDFITPTNRNLFQATDVQFNEHGTYVWQMIAGAGDSSRVRFGLSPDASFYLARTEDPQREFRGEEDCFIAALEWMHSLGVKLVHTSLGYSLDFDNPAENHKPEEMDGKTTALTKAAQVAAQKGMLIVKAAGNDGNNKDWQFINTPGDAKGVLTVGATDSLWRKPAFSAVGPDFLPYIKPNVVCFTPGGTSFSAPVITGLVSCMLEKDPTLTNEQIIRIIEKSGHLYPYGNTYLGYGVPDAGRVLKLMQSPGHDFGRTGKVNSRADKLLLQRATYGEDSVVVFHKKDDRVVIGQELARFENGSFVLNRPAGAKRSTVASRQKVVEVYWQ